VPELECPPAQAFRGRPALNGQVIEAGQRVLSPRRRHVAAENQAPKSSHNLEVEQRRSVQIWRCKGGSAAA